MVDFLFLEEPDDRPRVVGQGDEGRRGAGRCSTARSTAYADAPWDADALKAALETVGEGVGLKLGKAQAPVRVAVDRSHRRSAAVRVARGARPRAHAGAAACCPRTRLSSPRPCAGRRRRRGDTPSPGRRRRVGGGGAASRSRSSRSAGSSLLYVGVTFVQVWMASRHDGATQSDAIVVLGAAQYDGRPSPVLDSAARPRARAVAAKVSRRSSS